MSYAFTAQEQAEIDVLVNAITVLQATLVTQQTDFNTRDSDWNELRRYVENQINQKVWSTVVNAGTGKSPWDDEQARRVSINGILTTYAIPQIYLPDILSGKPDVYTNRAPEIRNLIYGTIEADLGTTRDSIVVKKDQLLQYYENLTTIDPIV